MNKAETKRFNELYQRHLRLLKLQGKSPKTIDSYSRAVRRISGYFDCCPDQLALEQRENFFPLWLSLIPGAPSEPSKPSVLTVMACNSSGSMSWNATGSGLK